MIAPIRPAHHAQLLRINERFVDWLSPLNQEGLDYVLSRAAYARQIDDAQAVLIGYPHTVDYPDHWNISWLTKKFDTFFYIDRIIVDERVHGKGYGKRLYADIETFAKTRGYPLLCCEVNTLPDNPTSHSFHLSQGFVPCGEQTHTSGKKAVRYYVKAL